MDFPEREELWTEMPHAVLSECLFFFTQRALEDLKRICVSASDVHLQ